MSQIRNVARAEIYRHMRVAYCAIFYRGAAEDSREENDIFSDEYNGRWSIYGSTNADSEI